MNVYQRQRQRAADIIAGKKSALLPAKQKYTKNTNPPASESGYKEGDLVYVLNYTNQNSETPMRFKGVIKDVLETYLRVKYLRNGIYYFNRYLPHQLEHRNEE